MPKMKKIFFGRNNKSRPLAFRNILFYQNVACLNWVINLFVSWVMFFFKKVSFPAKTAVAENFVKNLTNWFSSNLNIQFALDSIHITLKITRVNLCIKCLSGSCFYGKTEWSESAGKIENSHKIQTCFFN